MKKMLFTMSGVFTGAIVWAFLLLTGRKTVYILSDPGIGDIFPTCGYLPEYRKKHGIRHITVLGVKGKREMYQMYAQTYDRLILFPGLVFSGLCRFLSTDLGYVAAKASKRVISTRLGSNSRGNYVQRLKGITYLDTIKYGVYDLPAEAALAVPNIPDCDITLRIREYSLDYKNTVILNPYANSIEELPMSYYVLLSKGLESAGYRVVTNLSNQDQKPVPGTDGIVCTLAESFFLARFCGFAVGIRSGYFDFIAFTDCRIITLYPSGFPYLEYQRLSKWGINDNIFELMVNEEVEPDIAEVIGILTK